MTEMILGASPALINCACGFFVQAYCGSLFGWCFCFVRRILLSNVCPCETAILFEFVALMHVISRMQSNTVEDLLRQRQSRVSYHLPPVIERKDLAIR